MRFTILEEIKSTLSESVFYKYYSQIKSNVGFLMRGENRSTRRKTSHGRVTNKLNPHMTPSAEIEPGPHWWKASALTTTQNLPP